MMMILCNIPAFRADILETSTGAIEQMIEEFNVRGSVSLPMKKKPRVRVRTSRVRVALHVPRVRTLQALVKDWNVVKQVRFYYLFIFVRHVGFFF